MKLSSISRAVQRALLPIACASALAACAPLYDQTSAPVISSTASGTVVDNPDAVFDRADTNRDGYLSRTEVDALPITNRTAAPADPTMGFQRLDVDRDGFLNRSEAQYMLNSIPGASFDTIDSNRDGFISAAEAAPHLRWLESRGGFQQSWFDQYDSNRDGFLSRAEALPLLRDARQTAGRYETQPQMPVSSASFDRLDSNRDGFLSRAEAAPMLGSPGVFDQYDGNRDGFLSRVEADPLLRTGVGGTYPAPTGGTVYGPRY